MKIKLRFIKVYWNPVIHSFTCCGMTFKLQQSCSCNRDHVTKRAENSYYLTPVVKHDCIKFSHVKVSLQYLSVIMQTDNQRHIIQMSPINTKGTLMST